MCRSVGEGYVCAEAFGDTLRWFPHGHTEQRWTRLTQPHRLPPSNEGSRGMTERTMPLTISKVMRR